MKTHPIPTICLACTALALSACFALSAINLEEIANKKYIDMDISGLSEKSRLFFNLPYAWAVGDIDKEQYTDIAINEGWHIDYLSRYSRNPLPLQAGLCDIIGVGRITNAWEVAAPEHWKSQSFASLEVDCFWRGDPGTNSLTIEGHDNPPVTNAPIVFFITRYELLLYRMDIQWTYYDHVFDMDKVRERYEQHYEPNETPIFFAGASSWFHVNEENAALVTFASNLVFAVNSANTNAFFRTMFDGLKKDSCDSRIILDSCVALKHFSCHSRKNRFNLKGRPFLEKELLYLFWRLGSY